MGQKLEKKFGNKVQKLTNFTEKKDFSGQKNKLGLSLRRKKIIFWVKNWGKKLSIRDKKLPIFPPKKRDFLGQ